MPTRQPLDTPMGSLRVAGVANHALMAAGAARETVLKVSRARVIATSGAGARIASDEASSSYAVLSP